MNHLSVRFILAALVLLGSACGPTTPPAVPAPVQELPSEAVPPTPAPTHGLQAAAALEPTPEPTPTPTAALEPTPAPTIPAPVLKVGLVTDVGGVNDKSFNQLAWEGVRKAGVEFGWETKYIESKQTSDYEKNLDQFASAGYDVIIAVGYLMGDATALLARTYPDIKFAIVDFAYFPVEYSIPCGADVIDCYADGGLSNITSLMFQEDEAGFLAGILAAGMSGSGVICSVPGKEKPPVVRFVTGYQAGAQWYDPGVETLNAYVPSFIDSASGKEIALSMIGQGCDVIFGLGGKIGNGGLLAAKEEGLMAIGVDVDQYYTYPEVQEALLSSAAKHVGVAVYEYLKTVRDGTDQAGIVTANLQNNGVGLAPFHDWESRIPEQLKLKLEEAVEGLKNGTLNTGYVP